VAFNYRRLGLTRLVSLLCAVLVLQLSTGFVTAQQNVARPNQQVDGEPPDLLKKEIAASQAQTADKSQQSLIESRLPETDKMLKAREEYTVFAWKNRQDTDQTLSRPRPIGSSDCRRHSPFPAYARARPIALVWAAI